MVPQQALPYSRDAALEIARARLDLVWKYLFDFASLCRFPQECSLTTAQRSLMGAVLRGLDQERGGLLYGSEAATPGAFFIDGAVRLAKTGDQVGSPIEVNQDMLVTADGRRGFQPLSLAELLGIVVHELGHHHPASGLTHEDLDSLGAEFRTALQARLQRQLLQDPARAPRFGNEIWLEHLHIDDARGTTYDVGNSISIITLTGPFGLVRLSHALAGHECPTIYDETNWRILFRGSAKELAVEHLRPEKVSEADGRLTVMLDVPEAKLVCQISEWTPVGNVPFEPPPISWYFPFFGYSGKLRMSLPLEGEGTPEVGFEWRRPEDFIILRSQLRQQQDHVILYSSPVLVFPRLSDIEFAFYFRRRYFVVYGSTIAERIAMGLNFREVPGYD